MTLRIVDSYTVKKLRAERAVRFAAKRAKTEYYEAQSIQQQRIALDYLTRKFYKVSIV